MVVVVESGKLRREIRRKLYKNVAVHKIKPFTKGAACNYNTARHHQLQVLENILFYFIIKKWGNPLEINAL